MLLWMEEILKQFIGGLSMIIPNYPIILWFQLFQHVSAIQGARVLPQVEGTWTWNPRLFPERESEIDEEIDPGGTELVTVILLMFTDL